MPRSVYVLGIHDGHNASCALLKNGRIMAAISEERLNGIKNFIGFPLRSVRFICASASIRPGDVNHVAFAGKYLNPFLYHNLSGKSDSEYVRDIRSRLAANITTVIPYRLYQLVYAYVGSVQRNKVIQKYADLLGIHTGKISCFDHHLCHAACYFASPLRGKETLILTVDGEGDFNSSTVSKSDGTSIQLIDKTSHTSSLGLFFLEVTRYLGMKPNEDEHKVMGLGPYADSEKVKKLYGKLAHLFYIDPLDPLKIQSRVSSKSMIRHLPHILSDQRFDVIASASQMLIENLLVSYVKGAVRLTGIRNMFYSGGLSLNVKVNMKLAALEEIKRFYVMPSGGDESNAIGAAFLGCQKYANQIKSTCKPRSLSTLYLGPEYTDEVIQLSLNTYREKLSYQKPKDIDVKVAKLLSKGKIVARFSGKMEWGQRSLGNRSILANPSLVGVVEKINASIKNRDFWMPFAPSILESAFSDYVSDPKKMNSLFMNQAYATTPLGRDHLRFAMHPYDHTIRPQMVRKRDNESFYRLIESFSKFTGIRAVLNTSFNKHGYPIVCTPDDAIGVFLSSDLDYLALGGYLVAKENRKGIRTRGT